MQLVSKNFSGLGYQVLGDSGAGSAKVPTVVLLHGYGASGQDLIPLATYGGFAEKLGARWIFIQAPLAVPISPYENGWGWFQLDMEALFRWSQTQDLNALANWSPPDMEGISTRVRALIESESQSTSRLIVGGFSQGSMVCLDAVLGGLEVDALLLLSSTWISEKRWLNGLKTTKLPNIFQSHGKRDPILPIGAADRLNKELVAAGAHVEYHPFGGGHEIPLDVLLCLHRFTEYNISK